MTGEPSETPAEPPATEAERHDTGPDPKMLEALICPVTHGRLDYDREAQELISKQAHLAFPIRSGIPIMLEDEARKLED